MVLVKQKLQLMQSLKSIKFSIYNRNLNMITSSVDSLIGEIGTAGR